VRQASDALSRMSQLVNMTVIDEGAALSITDSSWPLKRICCHEGYFILWTPASRAARGLYKF